MAFVVPEVLEFVNTTILEFGYSANLSPWATTNENLEQRERGLDAVSYSPYTIPIILGGYAPVLSSKIVIGAPGTIPSGG